MNQKQEKMYKLIIVPRGYFNKIREHYGRDEVKLIKEIGGKLDNLMIKVPYGFIGQSSLME